MKIFFYGVIDCRNKGHFLYDVHGRQLWVKEQREFPFQFNILDGMLLPQSGPQEQGHPYLSIINGWTVLGMWDRSGDSRGNSNASFIAEGVFTVEQMIVLAEKNFPELWKRIKS